MNKFKLGLLLMAVLFPALVSADSPKKETIVLTSSNTIVLSDVVTSQSVGEIVEKVSSMNSGITNKLTNRPIYLFLNTPGGEVDSGLQLIEVLKAQGRPVHVITSFAASMGFQISQNLGRRYILQSGVLMSHRAAGSVEGQFGGSEPSQMQSRYKLWLDRVTQLDLQTVKRTNGKQTLESYQKAYADELWLTGPQAVEQGYADEIVNVTCDSSLDGVTTKSFQIPGGPTIDYDILNCPVVNGPMNPRVQVETNHGPKLLNEFRAQNGGFGEPCLALARLEPKTVCATDLDLNLDKIDQMRKDFMDRINNKKDHVIQMKF